MKMIIHLLFNTELYNHKFLFIGDVGVEVEEDLIEKYNLKDIDVLKVGHHGSKTSSSRNFVEIFKNDFTDETFIKEINKCRFFN